MTTPAIAYLHGFRHALPGPALAQAEGLAWLREALLRATGGGSRENVARALKLYDRLERACGVDFRASAVGDYRSKSWDSMELFRPGPRSAWFEPSLDSRMGIYERTALSLAEELLPCGERVPDFAIQVSCTGYASPHAVQRVAARRSWDSRVLHIGHMGCYAAVPASATAARLVRAEASMGRYGAWARLFFVELCTLHLKPGESSEQQVVMNALFADGALGMSVSSLPRPGALALLVSAEEIVPDSHEQMTWRLGDSAFAMTLGRDVPRLLGGAVRKFSERLLAQAGAGLKDVSHAAIHPGGPRIIERVVESLRLAPEAARHSREILRSRGNMSSCTLPHIWEAMLRDPSVREGDLILSLGFGPGLTLVGSLLRKT